MLERVVMRFTLYATKAPKVLYRIGIGSVIVGVANSDSAIIFVSRKGRTDRE